jgi:F-type H+-transporting ATPase subunit b
VAETVREADADLSQQGSAAQSELQSSVDPLSATLAGRILGVDLGARPPRNVSQ